MTVKLHGSFAIHPGPWLREHVLKPYGMTITGVAGHLQVSRPVLSRVLNGNAPITPKMAISFEEVFGISAGTLLRMQSSHDHAKRRLQ